MGQPQRVSKAPVAIALALIAGFVVMVMMGIAVLGGVWFMRASAFESQIQRERSTVEQQRQLIEQFNQAMLDETQLMEEVHELERATDQALQSWKAEMEVGERLKAERPRKVDDVEIVEVLDGGKVRIRWLSGQPGEEVIPLDRLRREEQ